LKAVGWLLDVYIQGRDAVLWVKTEDGRAFKLLDEYQPDFYVKLKNGWDLRETAAVLTEHPHVTDVSVEEKHVSITSRRKEPVLHIWGDEARSFRKVIDDVRSLGRVEAWFNTDLLHVQRYVFAKGCVPTAKLEVSFDGGSRLLAVRNLDDAWELRPPPFTWMILQAEVEGRGLSPHPDTDPIVEITTFDEKLEPVETFQGKEEEIISGFVDHVRRGDPDFLVAPECDEQTLPYLAERARRLGVELSLGREPSVPGSRQSKVCLFPGRVVLELGEFLQDGVAGLTEECRFTLAPPDLASRWAAGRKIDSRQCYEALRRDILIPKLRNYPKHGMTLKQVLYQDRGSLVFAPVVGLHENVAELDYESMFPNILIARNISYETVTPEGIDTSRPGFLGEITKPWLERRLHFKRLRAQYPKESNEWLWCEQRQSALKMNLVCIYGFSGCDVNRFGSVYAYSGINQEARKTLIRTLNIALREGFKPIYGDADCIFVKKAGATREDYQALADKIQREVSLPIVLDHHYRFLVFLRQEAHPEMEAVRRYFGKLMDGELYYRGIELRRRDCPDYLKEFQLELMRLLFHAESAAEVLGRQLKKTRELVMRTLETIAAGKVPPEKLVLRKMLRRPIDGYRSMLPHVSAAVQTLQQGKVFRRRYRIRDSQPIDFLYVNAEHPNPLRRVVAADLLDGDHGYYDAEKYQELALDIAETILGWNGFDGTQLSSRKPRGFLEQLGGQRQKETS